MRDSSLAGVPALNCSLLTRQTPGLVIFRHYLRPGTKQASACVRMHMAERHGKPLIIKFKFIPVYSWTYPLSTLFLAKLPTPNACCCPGSWADIGLLALPGSLPAASGLPQLQPFSALPTFSHPTRNCCHHRWVHIIINALLNFPSHLEPCRRCSHCGDKHYRNGYK